MPVITCSFLTKKKKPEKLSIVLMSAEQLIIDLTLEPIKIGQKYCNPLFLSNGFYWHPLKTQHYFWNTLCIAFSTQYNWWISFKHIKRVCLT